MTTRILRWLCRSPAALEYSQAQGLVRLRRRIALFDRLLGALGVGRSETYCWQRSSIAGVRVRTVRPCRDPSSLSAEAPLLIYLHGGAFVLRTLNGHMNLAAGIARTAGLEQALLPVYRLAPEHPFPAAVEDCLSVYRELLQQGHAGHRIVLAGDSAGGGLVLKLLMRLRDARLPMPACGVLLSPFTDLSCSGGSIRSNAPCDPMFGRVSVMHAGFYLGGVDPTDPRCSPLFGSFAGLPPLLAQVGSTERLLDDSLRLAPRVRRAGGQILVEVWESLPHVWQAMGMPESAQAIASIGRFVRERLQEIQMQDGYVQRRAA